MFDKIRLKNALAEYKRDFVSMQWRNEKYKWEVVKWFQDHWDVNASDFAAMLNRSLARTSNLLASMNIYPAQMITGFAKTAPEEVRDMFNALFDEGKDVYERINAFKMQSAVLLEKHGNGAGQHYQSENAISIYLWLRYPDKYYIYKFGGVKAAAEAIGSDYNFKEGAYENNIRNCYRLYDEICEELKQDTELVNLFKSKLTDTCYPDPELKTLAADVGFYISRFYSQKGAAGTKVALSGVAQSAAKAPRYWWLNANLKNWSLSKMPVGAVQPYTLLDKRGNPRRIYKNFLDARLGDKVIGYESKQITAICKISGEQDGKQIYFEKVEELTNPVDSTTLKRYPQLENLPSRQGSLFNLTRAQFDLIIRLIREKNALQPKSAVGIYTKNDTYTKDDFLEEVYMDETRYEKLAGVLRNKKNIILQGAPGVGKTFAAKRLAYSMMGEKDESRIEFVQFHQNYSYEDFIMGYKPVEDGFELKYGVFYRFCQKAANQPDKDYFFIIDEINCGNMSKIFGELLMLIERDYRGTKATLAYNGIAFSVPRNLYIIGMMNTADRSLAMIDYALRRRFSFFEMEPGFDSDGFIRYQNGLNNETLNELVAKVKDLNKEIVLDKSLGKGFRIGHSYFCGRDVCTEEWLRSIVDYDILSMLSEYWFDDDAKLQRWENILQGVFQ